MSKIDVVALSGLAILALMFVDLMLCAKYGFGKKWCFVCFLAEGPTEQRADDLRGNAKINS